MRRNTSSATISIGIGISIDIDIDISIGVIYLEAGPSGELDPKRPL
jgi:hypothetical protein